MRLEGLALPFNTWCFHADLGPDGGYSQFAPGSFTDYISGGMIRLNVHHQQARTIAAQETGNLRVWETAEGVMFEADVDPSPLATFLEHAIVHGFARNVCPCVVSTGTYLPTKPGEPRRIVQRQVFGCDFAILLAAVGHYPSTWVRVR